MTTAHLLAELRDPACYPHAVPDVQIVQTHLSIVCLGGDFAYKLKKSRKLPFVDFSSLAARRGFCRDEVRLNRRLCPDTYLGTCALRRTAAGLRFAAVGDDDGPDDLDVAVVMRRLPADRMLDVLLQSRSVTAAEIEHLARLVAAFHAAADRSAPVLAAGDPHSLAAFARANFTELQALPNHGLPATLLAALAKATDGAFTALLPRLVARAARGQVVDGHGDLHARNVCMTTPPAVYDCIEFAPAFRCGDVATENAFLAMDLRYRGAPDLAAAYLRAYVAASGDTEQPELLGPLIAYRAMVRAKVAALAAAEPELPAADRAGARASSLRHLLLAAAVTIEARGPLWLVVCGPPASGKSALCRQLAEAAHWPHFNTDAVRKELAGLQPTQRATAAHYTPEFSDRTYRDTILRAVCATKADAPVETKAGAPVVLLDGNFPTPDRRAEAAAAAFWQGIHAVFVHVDVDVATARTRAANRARADDNASDAGPDIAATLHAKFVAPAIAEGLAILQLDGARPTDDLVAEVLRQVLEHAPVALTYEPVLDPCGYYDGPREGFANYRGHLHHYECEWDDAADDYADTFQLAPVDDVTVQLALERQQIFMAWQAALHRGAATWDSHPGKRGTNPRYDELGSQIDARLALCARLPFAVRAHVRLRAEQPPLPPGVDRMLEVAWQESAGAKRKLPPPKR